MNTITKTNFNFPKQTNYYKGKVRDVYTIDGKMLVMVVSDRISAFDVVLPKGIPYKGQLLNQIASRFLKDTEDILPNWVICSSVKSSGNSTVKLIIKFPTCSSRFNPILLITLL